MKKRKLAKKLELNLETLRNITDSKAELVNGGTLCHVYPSCGQLCTDTVCDTGCQC